jgi:hypothetical protein
VTAVWRRIGAARDRRARKHAPADICPRQRAS